MPKFRFYLSVGFPTAKRQEVFEIPEEDLEDLEGWERENEIIRILEDWAANYIETWYEEIEE